MPRTPAALALLALGQIQHAAGYQVDTAATFTWHAYWRHDRRTVLLRPAVWQLEHRTVVAVARLQGALARYRAIEDVLPRRPHAIERRHANAAIEQTGTLRAAGCCGPPLENDPQKENNEWTSHSRSANGSSTPCPA